MNVEKVAAINKIQVRINTCFYVAITAILLRRTSIYTHSFLLGGFCCCCCYNEIKMKAPIQTDIARAAIKMCIHN